MSQYYKVHSSHPQLRLIRQAVAILNSGGIVVYPTDSTYAIGCRLGDVASIERMRELRGLPKNHLFTLVCRDLSELSQYARVDNASFRIIRRLTPGPYTLILKATKEAPKKLVHPKRKTVGLRIPDSAVVQLLIQELGSPLLSTSMIPIEHELPLMDAEEIRLRYEHAVDAILDVGFVGHEPTTILDLSADEPKVLRKGLGADAI